MKTGQPKPKLNRQILDEASAWFVDFRVGDVDLTARERFDQWLRQSPEHIRAYMEIARTYVELPALNPERKSMCRSSSPTRAPTATSSHSNTPRTPISRSLRLRSRTAHSPPKGRGRSTRGRPRQFQDRAVPG